MTIRRRNSKTEFSLWKHIKCFLFTPRTRSLMTQQSLSASLDLCLRKTRAEKSHHFWDVIAFENYVFLMSVDGRPNRRNKAAFLNFCGAIWTGPKIEGSSRIHWLPDIYALCTEGNELKIWCHGQYRFFYLLIHYLAKAHHRGSPKKNVNLDQTWK